MNVYVYDCAMLDMPDRPGAGNPTPLDLDRLLTIDEYAEAGWPFGKDYNKYKQKWEADHAKPLNPWGLPWYVWQDETGETRRRLRDQYIPSEMMTDTWEEFEKLHKPKIIILSDYAEVQKAWELTKNKTPKPIKSRDDLLLSSWIVKDIEARDYLLGGVLCTTSRWLIVGETGIGKTLIGLDIAGAIAAGNSFLNWSGQGKPRRVMYLDGELPQETFKERMQLIAKRYGPDIQLYGYNREALGDEAMPPLNTPEGQKWLRREIAFIKPDAIFFDSMMCLLSGSLKEEEAWIEMKPFVRELTAKRVAQIWFNHANDLGKSFGDKTRGWEMDTIAVMTKANTDDEEDNAIRFEFTKARLRVPATFDQFQSMIIRPGDGLASRARPQTQWEIGQVSRSHP